MFGYVTVYGTDKETGEPTAYHAILKGRGYGDLNKKVSAYTDHIGLHFAKLPCKETTGKEVNTINKCKYFKTESELSDFIDNRSIQSGLNSATLKHNLFSVSFSTGIYGELYHKVSGKVYKMLTNQLCLNF